MAIKQLSVFAENSPGSVSEIIGTLADAGIDLRAVSIADTADYGILRLIVSDTARAEQILRDSGRIATVNHVLAVEVDDRPGGLAAILRLLNEEAINLEYLYAFFSHSVKNAFVVIRTTDRPRAEELLTARHYRLLEQTDVDAV